MKKIFYLPIIVLLVFSSCTSLDDTEIPVLKEVYVNENFTKLDENSNLEVDGWQNINEVGSEKWFADDYNDNFYAKFSSYQSGDLENVAWLITPEFTTESNAKFFMRFKSAQNFVSNNDNKLEVLISKDYDGTNFSASTWTAIPAIVANSSTTGYAFIDSGKIDLSEFAGGKTRVAFKVTGSGTNTNLDGLFQVDDIVIMNN